MRSGRVFNLHERRAVACCARMDSHAFSCHRRSVVCARPERRFGPGETDAVGHRTPPTRVRPTMTENRADRYRQRATAARAEAERTTDEVVSTGLRQIAELWERMAAYIDKKNASRSS